VGVSPVDLLHVQAKAVDSLERHELTQVGSAPPLRGATIRFAVARFRWLQTLVSATM
jgi:hypothetical protein